MLEHSTVARADQRSDAVREHAVGIRVWDLSITNDKVLRRLAEQARSWPGGEQRV
jgi:hypothetical protein